jgi:hypothetical protein
MARAESTLHYKLSPHMGMAMQMQIDGVWAATRLPQHAPVASVEACHEWKARRG